MQLNLVKAHTLNKKKSTVQKVWKQLRMHTANCKKLNSFIAIKKFAIMDSCFQQLKDNIDRKYYKKQLQLAAKQQRESKLMEMAFRGLKEHTIRMLKFSMVKQANKQRTVNAALSAWCLLAGLRMTQRKVMTSVCQSKRRNQLSQAFSGWLKQTNLVKLCLVIQQQMNISEDSDDQRDIKRRILGALRYQTQRSKQLTQLYDRVRQRSTQGQQLRVLQAWRKAMKDTVIAFKLTKIFQPIVKDSF